MSLLSSVADLPPIHWFLHLPPVEWLGSILDGIFAQAPLQWAEDRFGWMLFMGLAMLCLTGETLWCLWVWLRARQVNYDSVAARTWSDGRPRQKPVDVEKGLYRKYAWPFVVLPLYLVAVGMYTWYLLWPGTASRLLLAGLWLGFLPARRAWTILIARKAFVANNPGFRLETTWLQDVHSYYLTGFTGPKQNKKLSEPPFENVGIYKVANAFHRVFSRYGLFWRLFRFWNIVRFWGVLVHVLMAFCWPIAAVFAPFYYMACVHDYKNSLTPWARAWRKNNEYHGKVVRGTVVARDGEPA